MPRRPPYKNIASCISVNGLLEKLFLVIRQITLHIVCIFSCLVKKLKYFLFLEIKM